LSDRDQRNERFSSSEYAIKTLKKWKNEIANYFVNRNTSAFVEGLNNKIKVLKRRCYGIYNLKHFFQRLFLDLSGYELYARKREG
jgi:transposase